MRLIHPWPINQLKYHSFRQELDYKIIVHFLQMMEINILCSAEIDFHLNDYKSALTEIVKATIYIIIVIYKTIRATL